MNIEVNGVSLNYRIDGRGDAPWLTFSNSLATNLSMWDAQVAALKDDYRILRYDKRGHGDSKPKAGAYAMSDLVADIVALWDALGIERTHFVGLSIGGMTALGLALDYPGRVATIAVCDSRADAPGPYREVWEPRIATARGQGMAVLAQPTLERWFTPGFRARDKATIDRFTTMISDTSVDGYCGCGRALQNLAYLPHLGRIKTPTLVLCGLDDQMLEPSRDMAKRIPGAEYVEFGPAGHIANIEQPEKFTAAIRDFLARHPM